MSPLQMNPLAEYVIPMDDQTPVEIRPGREIYDEHSISGLNKLPIAILRSFVVAGADISDPDLFDINDIAERALVDGGIVIADRTTPLDRIVEITDLYILQRIEPEGDPPQYREYMRLTDESPWTVTDIEKMGEKEETKVSQASIAAENLIPFPNGKGVLWPVQRSYVRLEQIAQTVERQTSGPAATTTMIFGFAGDLAQARTQMNAGHRFIFMPGDARAEKVASTAITDQLMKEFERLLPIYFRNCNIVDVNDSVSMSGVARRLTMLPMLVFVRQTQDFVQTVFEEFGITVEFGRIPIDTVDEQIRQLELLERLLNIGVIDRNEFTEKAKLLASSPV